MTCAPQLIEVPERLATTLHSDYIGWMLPFTIQGDCVYIDPDDIAKAFASELRRAETSLCGLGGEVIAECYGNFAYFFEVLDKMNRVAREQYGIGSGVSSEFTGYDPDCRSVWGQIVAERPTRPGATINFAYSGGSLYLSYGPNESEKLENEADQRKMVEFVQPFILGYFVE